MTGNQNSLLSQKYGFKCQGEGNVQIHHDGDRVHWLTSTMQEGQVIVYDSKSCRGLSQDMEQQLKAIYGGSRSVVIPHIAQQHGSKDCGLFAIAHAWHLAQDDKPQDLVFEQKKMREHLINCFDSVQLRPFPHTQKRATRTVSDYHTLE